MKTRCFYDASFPLAQSRLAAGRAFSTASANIKPTYGLNLRRDDVTGRLNIEGYS